MKRIFLPLLLLLLNTTIQAQYPSYVTARKDLPAYINATSASNPIDLEIGDFNEDLRKDFCVVLYNQSALQINLQMADGSFTTSNYTVLAKPQLVLVKDLNEDGHQDCIVTFETGNIIQILSGNGDGTFSNAISFSTGATGQIRRGLLIEDIDGDSHLDLLLSGYNLYFFKGNGDGTFQAAITTGGGVHTGERLALADFNNDSKLDLVATPNVFTSILCYTFTGNGDGTFTNPVSQTAFGGDISMVPLDFNTDGKTDLICGAGKIVLGNGDGTFQAPVSLASYSTRPGSSSLYANGELVYSDLNGDGVNDMIGYSRLSNNSNSQSQFCVIQGNANGTSTPISYLGIRTKISDIKVADFNSDGTMDVLVSSYNESVISVLYGNGDLTFGSHPHINLNDPAQSFNGVFIREFEVFDKNQDGNQDVIAGRNGAGVAGFNGDGNHTFTAGTSEITLDALTFSTSADVNNDNRTDLILLKYGTNYVSVYRTMPDGTFSTSSVTNLPNTEGYDLKTADLNNDNNIDLVVATGFSSSVFYYYYGDGNGGFTLGGNTTTMSNGIEFALSDINLDGYIDIVALPCSTGTISLLKGQPAGGFTSPVSVGSTGYCGKVTVADFNNDLFPDIAIAIPFSDGVAVHLNDQSGGFVSAGGFNKTGTKPMAIESADLNYDGNMDIVTANEVNNTISFLPGNGDGTFLSHMMYATNSNPNSLKISDLNNDLIPDILVFNQYTSDVFMYISSGAQPWLSATRTGTSPLSATYGQSISDFSYLLKGAILAGDVQITAPSGLLISLDGISFSSSLTVTPVSGRIPTNTKMYVRTPPVINAGTYNYQISCTVDNSTLTTNIPVTLTVNKAPLVITAYNNATFYGYTTPAFKYKITGFVLGEDSTVIDVLPVLATTATQSSSVGTYSVIQGVLASDNNYSFTYVGSNFNIVKLPLDVEWFSYSRFYGQPNRPAYKITGFMLGEDSTVIDVLPVVTTGATITSSVGTYTATCSGASDNNYSFIYRNGTITIQKAPLIIRPNDEQREEGQPNPVFSLLITGFVNNEDITVLDVQPSIYCSATTSSSPGTYPITALGGSDNNYSYGFEDGTLTVTVATSILSAEDIVATSPIPNPASSMFSFANLSGFSKATICDLQGKTMGEYTEYPIDVTSYPNGTYMIKVETERGQITHMGVVQH